MKIQRFIESVAGCGALLLAEPSLADTTFLINNTTADAFLATGSAANPAGADLTGLNFGGAGTLAIAPASSTKGAFASVIKFNTAAAVSQFDTIYGAGQWRLSGITLSLSSNFGVQGSQPNNNIFNTINAGSFGIDWLGNDSWVEGSGGANGVPGYPNNSAVSYNSIAGLYSSGSSSLGTFTYTPPGNNVYGNYTLPLDVSLVSDASRGGDVSFYLYASDNQVSYLFNARSFASGHPELTLNASIVPEPCAGALLGAGTSALLIFRTWRKKK